MFFNTCTKSPESLVNLMMDSVRDTVAYLHPLTHTVHHVAETMTMLIAWVVEWAEIHNNI